MRGCQLPPRDTLKSGRWDSNPRISAWKADALPLGDSRVQKLYLRAVLYGCFAFWASNFFVTHSKKLNVILILLSYRTSIAPAALGSNPWGNFVLRAYT